jgi:penicillin-binding protein 1A
MGIRTPVSSNYAITLGGLKRGVTPLDLAHAYETLATGGVLVSGTLGARERGPVGIRRVSMRDSGRLRAHNQPRRRRVLPKNVADTTTNILQSVITVGTGKVASLGGVRAWGKTGTTEGYGDAWFVGATDKLTVAVWVGYPNTVQGMRSEYNGDPVAGGTFPALIWHDFMTAALDADRRRLERQCEADQAKVADQPEAAPPASCVKAGLASDPSAQTDAGSAQTGTTPSDPNATGNAPADGGGTATTPRTGADAATPATPAGAQPAPPPADQAPQAPAAPADGSAGAAPSGGAAPGTP